MTDNEEIALALLLWRYVGHRITMGAGSVPRDSIERADMALQLAKRVGVKDEYLRAVFAHPVMTIRVKELE